MIDCNICYDIFISYRNKGGKQVARQLHKWLSETEGYSTFYDDECLREGRWDKALLRHVKRCRDFLLIVDRHTFDRIYDESYSVEDDWVRKELSEALKMGDDVINIIPIILPKAKLPLNLPLDISEIRKWQWVNIKTLYDLWDKFKEIKQRLHSKPTQIQDEYINPIIPNAINTNELMRKVNEFVMSGVLLAFEMSSNSIKLTFK